MAWSRFSDDSSVYTFPNTDDQLECCACSLVGPPGDLGSFRTVSVDVFLTHLEHHVEAGHRVPDLLPGLVREEGPEYLANPRKERK